MKSGFRRTLEGIVLGALAAAVIGTLAACVPKAPVPPPPPPITTPYTIQDTRASLGYYGPDGKLVVVDVDGIGDKVYDYLWGNENTFLASKVLKLDNYSVIIGGDKDGTGTGVYVFAAFFNSNSELIGTAQNRGKFEGLAISGDYAIMGWKLNYDGQNRHKSNPENNPILDALSKSLGYKSNGDPGDSGPLITIGPSLDVQIDGQPRGKNTDYGAKVSVYRLNPASPNSTTVEKIASQPPTLKPSYARNQAIEAMEIVDEGGNLMINLEISYEANDGKRYAIPQPGKASLDALISSGIAAEGNVKPLLK